MNEDAKKTLQPMISNVNDEIKGTMNFDELLKASTSKVSKIKIIIH